MSGHITTDAQQAVAVLAAGGVVALPTETVYGLAADATCPDAVARIFAIKGRPSDHPLIVHIADPEDLALWCTDVPESAQRLAALAWPGPLSLIVPRGPRIDAGVTGGRDTMAVRCPAHPVAREIIRRLGRPVAAPSANRFGRVSPTTAQHVAHDLGHDVDLIVDGGPCQVGLESTIVDCTVDPVQVLRPGSIDAQHIAALLEAPVAAAAGPVRAPGMLAVHYAPSCRVHVAESWAQAIALRSQLEVGSGFVDILDLSTDVVAAARNLYQWLRDADQRQLTDVVVVLPEPQGLGIAIRDRVTRAAAAH